MSSPRSQKDAEENSFDDVFIITPRVQYFGPAVSLLKSKGYRYSLQGKYWYGKGNFWEIEDLTYLHAVYSESEFKRFKTKIHLNEIIWIS